MTEGVAGGGGGASGGEANVIDDVELRLQDNSAPSPAFGDGGVVAKVKRILVNLFDIANSWTQPQSYPNVAMAAGAANFDNAVVYTATVTGALTVTVSGAPVENVPYRVRLAMDGTGGHTVTIAGATLAANLEAIDTRAGNTSILYFEGVGGAWRLSHIGVEA